MIARDDRRQQPLYPAGKPGQFLRPVTVLQARQQAENPEYALGGTCRGRKGDQERIDLAGEAGRDEGGDVAVDRFNQLLLFAGRGFERRQQLGDAHAVSAAE